MSAVSLKRSIGLPLLTLYGLGTILGAGIYVLIGEVAGLAGRAAPSAFLLASVIAGCTALSFAELASRLPKSAGEAAYVDAAFGRPWLAALVGWSVILNGTVSAATMTRGFVGYLEVFADWPPSLVILTVVGALAALAAWGIGESLIAAALITLLETAGLVFVCVVAGDSFASLPQAWPSLLPGRDIALWLGVFSGGFLAFYAFIGFEDMVNIAEEVRDPTKTLPRGIVLALLLSTTLYLLVATVAVLSMPPERLAATGAPLALLVESKGLPPQSIAAISLIAVLNGALIQLIMASRILYGMASQGLTAAVFARVHPVTRTPLLGTAAVAAAIALLALFFSLGGLARVTSFMALSIFALVNASLWRMKTRDAERPAFTVPLAVPIAGLLLCLSMLSYQLATLLSAA